VRTISKVSFFLPYICSVLGIKFSLVFKNGIEDFLLEIEGICYFLICLLDRQFRLVLWDLLLKIVRAKRKDSEDLVKEVDLLNQKQNPSNVFLYSSINLQAVCSILTAVQTSMDIATRCPLNFSTKFKNFPYFTNIKLKEAY
jgi:uncharacterized membrane protein YkvI